MNKANKTQKYMVLVPEVHVSYREVEAENEADAIELAMGNIVSTEVDFSYSYTLENDIEVQERTDE